MTDDPISKVGLLCLKRSLNTSSTDPPSATNVALKLGENENQLWYNRFWCYDNVCVKQVMIVYVHVMRSMTACVLTSMTVYAIQSMTVWVTLSMIRRYWGFEIGHWVSKSLSHQTPAVHQHHPHIYVAYSTSTGSIIFKQNFHKSGKTYQLTNQSACLLKPTKFLIWLVYT